jgi:metallophosphoesterase (TIGR00282 family)
MKILYFGDLVGRVGRTALFDVIDAIRAELEPDFIIVNGENAAHGFGITEKICEQVFAAGADVITTGNHAWDQREIMNYIGGEPRLLRPLNYPKGTPGNGAGLFEARGGGRVFVAQIMGRLFMDAIDDPFARIDEELAELRLGANGDGGADAIVVDIHAEATSEKMAVGHFLDGRVSLVAGTHTHVPSADAQILPGGTAYQSDIGMCGDYDSVIGMKKGEAINRFTKKLPSERLEPAEAEATLCAVLVETDAASGLASRIEPLRLGPRLIETRPT